MASGARDAGAGEGTECVEWIPLTADMALVACRLEIKELVSGDTASSYRVRLR